MRTLKMTYWKDDQVYVGNRNDFPDYRTQGASKEELIDNLKDLLEGIESGEVPYIRKIEELPVA